MSQPYQHTSPLPGSTAFTLLNLLLHLNLALHLLLPFLSSSHPLRSFLPPRLPLPHRHILALASLAPAFALVSRRSWADVLWWTVSAGLAWLVWSASRWMAEEEREIESLEGMRYDAKGA